VKDAELLAEQVAYYRARAPRYDEWWQRCGVYDMGPELAAEWDRQLALVEEALATFSVSGHVLELAGGTGWWTQRLARCAETLTVVDSSPEALEISRSRTDRDDIAYKVADVFSWLPDRAYDVVFFSFWLSHVPRQRSRAFWSMVRSCLSTTMIRFHRRTSRIPMFWTTNPTDTSDEWTMVVSSTSSKSCTSQMSSRPNWRT
jgi:ubiquinone/menaquinone biosynthesis C-methylase UbiE